jgi:hypothetical protein
MFAMTFLYQKLPSNRPLCENYHTDCHTFTVRWFILLLNIKPTAITAEHNQWQYKHKSSDPQTTVSTVHYSVMFVTYIVKHWNKIYRETLCDHNVTLSCVRLVVVGLQYWYRYSKNGQEICKPVGVLMDTAIRHGLSLADSSCKQHSFGALE